MAVQTAYSVQSSGRREMIYNMLHPIREEGYQRLKKIGAYIRKVSQNSLKTAVGEGDVSKAGATPKVHNPVFKNLIVFEVDKLNLTAYVGASIKTSAKKNPQGQTIPSMMEEGGNPIDTDDSPQWLYRTKVPKTANSVEGMSLYFMSMGAAPFCLANTDGSKEQNKKSYRKAISYVLGDTKKGVEVILQYVKMKTIRQAVHAANFVISLFGFPHPAVAKPYVIEPRPFMSKALNRSKHFINKQISNLYKNR